MNAALPLLAALLAALGVALALRVPGYEPALALAFAVSLAWRLLAGLDGRRLLPRRVLGGLFATLLALALPYLFAVGGRGVGVLPALLGTLTALATVALLGRLDAFGAFWLVLLSSTHAAGASTVGRDPAGLLLVPAYVAALAATLVVLERNVAAERRRLTGDRVRLLRTRRGRPGRALARGTLRLVTLGFALGLLVWALAPRPEIGAEDAPTAGRGATAADWDPSTDWGGSSARATGVTGPDEGSNGASIGAVGRIKADNRVHLEYRLLQGDAERPVALRQDVLDLWIDDPDPERTGWHSSAGLARSLVLRPGGDGWMTLGEVADHPPARTYSLTLRQPRQLLFLEPDPQRFRLLRPSAVGEDGERTGPPAALGASVVRRANEELRPSERLAPGDVVEAVSSLPPDGDSDLLGRMSGPDLAPLRSTVDLEPGLAARLRALVRDVPAVSAADPWRKARALEAWLKSPAFVYALESPNLDPKGRLLHFVTRVRRGNCEWFATALTLLLRAHGLPARYVRGYWGGSHTAGSRLWTFSGTHYHAWTELYLEGAGWVPLNPTPPERAADQTETRSEPAPRTEPGPAAEQGASAEPAGAALRRWLGEALVRCVARPLAGLFTREVGYAGLWASGLVLLWIGLRGGRRTLSRARGRRTGPARQGYAAALALLAAHGHHRGPGQTARAFLEAVRDVLPPEAAKAFQALTQQHERERYAGLGHEEAGTPLLALRRALSQRAVNGRA